MLFSMLKRGVLTLFLPAAAALAQTHAPVFDPRLSVHAIVREDIFAGFLVNDLERLAKGEKNLEVLLAERPQEKAPLLAWKAGIALTRAAHAHEAGKKADFEREYRKAVSLFEEAAKAGPTNGGVIAITGGSYSQLADRLPEPQRAAGWQAAYQAYRMLLQAQKDQVDGFPLHLKGELLGGLALTAQRTGRADEAGPYLERIVQSMPGTAYATAARRWIERPETRAKSSVACHSCHEPGKLEARKAALAAAK
jgi:tetratricopeptide (TPR) repeat protein